MLTPTTHHIMTSKLQIRRNVVVDLKCDEIAAIKPDPQKSTIDSTIIGLPFLCKPFSDKTPFVERKNGLYVFQIESCNIMFVFLKDKSASYQKEKKKKTKATKIDLSSLNIDSDDSEVDSDYDPFDDDDDFLDDNVDASYYYEQLVEIFGNAKGAEDAIKGLNAGGEEAIKYKHIIFHLRKARDLNGGTSSAKMDVDDEDDNDDE